MERRDFFGFTAMIGGGMLLSACNESDAAAVATTQPKPTGAVTMYYEIRVPGPEKTAVLGNIDNLITTMKTKTGYLSISFKQMTGESTMVKNYPDNFKGILNRGFVSPLQPSPPKVPFFYMSCAKILIPTSTVFM